MAGKYFRVNTIKSDTEQVINSLKGKGFDISESELEGCFEVISAPEDLRISRTSEFEKGEIYIQDISSQLVPKILAPSEREIVFDVSASPGSKTTQMATMMNNTGFLIANDPNKKRIGRLYFNLKNQGTKNVVITNLRGESISRRFNNFFDKILVDPPCTSLGTEEKNKNIKKNWYKNKSLNLARLQFKILTSCFFALKKGGEMTYSTCTTRVEENEMVLDKFMKKFGHKAEIVNIKEIWGSKITLDESPKDIVLKYQEIIDKTIRLGRVGEGFFIAKIRKIEETHQGRELRSGRFDLSRFEMVKENSDSVVLQGNEKIYEIKKSVFEFIKNGFPASLLLIEED